MARLDLGHWPVPTWRGRSVLSLATALLYLVAGVGLVSSGILHDPGRNPRSALLALGILALLFVVWALVRGRRFTRTEALVMLVPNMATVVVLSHTTHLDLGAVSNGVSLPLTGVYAAWLLIPRARFLVYVGALCWLVVLMGRDSRFTSSIGISVLIETVIASEITRAFFRRVQELSNLDRLTGVLNRHGLETMGGWLIEEARRRGRPFSLAVVDLDGLREMNNQHGHAAGDSLLMRATREWRAELGGRTLVGRMGGDEFVLFFPDLGDEAARYAVTEMRGRSEVSWTAGVTDLQTGDTYTTMVERADAEMYFAKRQRRQRSTDVAPVDLTRDR